MLAGVLLTFTSVIAVTQAATPTPAAPALQPSGTIAAPVVQRAAPSESPAPGAGTKMQATNSSTLENRKPDPAQGLDLVRVQIRYSRAEALVSFIKSAPGAGLISDKGSIAFDPDTNTILVQDTASNVATLRRLLETMDTPPAQVYIEATVARIDSALAEELMRAAGRGGSWAPTTLLDSPQSVIVILEAAQRDHQAEVVRLTNVVATNRMQVSAQSGSPIRLPSDAPDAEPRFLGYKLLATPTIQPANRVALDVDITFDALAPNSGVAPASADALPPSIDTSQFRAQVVLDSGSTVMLTTMSSSGKHLVAFVTPRVLPNPAANPK